MRRTCLLILLLLIPALAQARPSNFGTPIKRMRKSVRTLNDVMFGKQLKNAQEQDSVHESGLMERVRLLELHLANAIAAVSALTEQVNSTRTFTGIEKVEAAATKNAHVDAIIGAQAVCPSGKVVIGGSCEPCADVRVQSFDTMKSPFGRESWLCVYRVVERSAGGPSGWWPPLPNAPTCTVTAKAYCADAIADSK